MLYGSQVYFSQRCTKILWTCSSLQLLYSYYIMTGGQYILQYTNCVCECEREKDGWMDGGRESEPAMQWKNCLDGRVNIHLCLFCNQWCIVVWKNKWLLHLVVHITSLFHCIFIFCLYCKQATMSTAKTLQAQQSLESEGSCFGRTIYDKIPSLVLEYPLSCMF